MARVRIVPVILTSSCFALLGYFLIQYFRPPFLIKQQPAPRTEDLSVTFPLSGESEIEGDTEAEPVVDLLPSRTEREQEPSRLPPQWNVPTKIVRDPAKIQEYIAAWSKNDPHMKELLEAEKKFSKRMREALSSEDAAKLALEELETCVVNAPKIAEIEVSDKLPQEMKERIKSAGPQAQAGCIAYAEKIADRFPTLDEQVEKNLKSKATPEAKEHLKKFKAVYVDFAPGR